MSDGSTRKAGWFLDFAGRRLEMEPGSLVIGRGPDRESADALLPVSDSTVSRHHARLHLEGDRLTVTDLASSNGTFVNDRRVEGEVELTAGDRLRLGRVRLVVARGEAGDGESPVPGRKRPRRRFCPTCGSGVSPRDVTCPHCGENLTQERPLSRSEAIAMSEVMPVGEALALPPRRRDADSPMPWDEPSPETAPGSPLLEETGRFDTLTGLGTATVEDEAGDEVERVEEEAARGAGQARPLFLPAAGFLRRTTAALADAALVAAAGLGGVVAAAFGAGVGPGPTLWWVGGGTALAAWFLVSLAGWWRWGTTPGKRLLRLWVCDLDGRPGISAGRSLVRFAGYVLSAATLGYGYLRVGMAADGRALHDHLAGTYVAHPSPEFRLSKGRGPGRRFRRRGRPDADGANG